MVKLSKFIIKAIEYVFWALVVLIFTVFTYSFCETLTAGPIKYVLVAVILLSVIFFFYFSEKIFEKFYFIKKMIDSLSIKKMCLILFLFILASKVFFVFLLENDPSKHPDMARYYSMAVDLAQNGKISEYFTSAFLFPYEPIYGLFLSPVVKLFGKDPRFILSFLSLLNAILNVLLFDIIRPYIGKNKAFTAILLFNILPEGLFQTQLLTHENALLFFYVASLWLYLKSINEKIHPLIRVICLVASALLISFGKNINAGGYIVVISMCIYSLLNVISTQISIKKLFILLVTFLCYALCLVTISDFCSSFTETHVDKPQQQIVQIKNNISKSVTMGWGLFIGLNTECPGVWNQEDLDVYNKYYDMEEDEAKEYQTNLIKERLKVFSDDPLLIPGHLMKKMARLWSGVYLPFVYEQGNEINNFILKGFHGVLNKSLLFIGYIEKILIYSIIILSFKRKRINDLKSEITPLLQFKMMPIGLTMSLILFEVMPKYVSHMSIIMFVIAVFSYSSYIDNSIRFKSRVNKFLKRSDSGSPASEK